MKHVIHFILYIGHAHLSKNQYDRAEDIVNIETNGVNRIPYYCIYCMTFRLKKMQNNYQQQIILQSFSVIFCFFGIILCLFLFFFIFFLLIFCLSVVILFLCVLSLLIVLYGHRVCKFIIL